MKKHFFGLISLLLIMGIVAIGCSGGGSPTSVVKRLHTAIEKGDLKAIGQLMTPGAAQMTVLMADKARGMIATYGGITKTEESIDGNNAVVKVTYKNGETSTQELVKIDGKWKVTMEK